MPNSYKGYSLRNRIFLGFLAICLLSIVGAGILSYILLKNNYKEQSRRDLQKKSDMIMATLDYAVSDKTVQTKDIPQILQQPIMEIADVNKQDIIIYDLNGNYLLSNKEPNLVEKKQISPEIINNLLKFEKRIDEESLDKETQNTVTSSCLLLKNNVLESIAIVYLPYYHNNSEYLKVFNSYLKYMVVIDFFIILVAIWLSWFISKNLTKTLSRFSDKINNINLLEGEFEPIPYYRDDELKPLVTGYNRMILQLQTQKEALAHTEREIAWKEMAKQVAHEVKNPLTPMKLTVQNFQRKFDPEDPKISEKVKNLSETLTEQIDLIATVASAFSKFAQLPERNDEIFDLNKELKQILNVFSSDHIFFHSNKDQILVKMDRVFLNRIITNLITNAQQAESMTRRPLINVDSELYNKRIIIKIEDNGTGIPPEILDKIFQPNFTSKNSGMGLGLSMVKNMIEDYQGEITVDTELDKGTKFTISFPNNL